MADIRKTLMLKEITQEEYEDLRRLNGFKNKKDFKEPENEGYAEIVQPLRYPTFDVVLTAFINEGQLSSIRVPRGTEPLQCVSRDVLQSADQRLVYVRRAAKHGFLYVYFSEKEPPHRIGFEVNDSSGAVVSKSVMLPGLEWNHYEWESGIPQAYHFVRGLRRPDHQT